LLLNSSDILRLGIHDSYCIAVDGFRSIERCIHARIFSVPLQRSLGRLGWHQSVVTWKQGVVDLLRLQVWNKRSIFTTQTRDMHVISDISDRKALPYMPLYNGYAPTWVNGRRA
jgi:hypothetical protein